MKIRDTRLAATFTRINAISRLELCKHLVSVEIVKAYDVFQKKQQLKRIINYQRFGKMH